MGEGDEGELLALYWTVSGPADVHVGREWSTFDWRDRCAEAQRVGFKGLGLWHADIEHQLETRTLAEMKQIFDDADGLLAGSLVLFEDDRDLCSGRDILADPMRHFKTGQALTIEFP